MTKSKRRLYSESFKLEVLRDFYSSGSSQCFAAKKWNLNSNEVLRSWIKRYPVDCNLLSLDIQTISFNCMCDPSRTKEELLEEELIKLRKALEIEKLRSHGFEKLIEIAEKEEGIYILKKDGAKQ